MTSAATLRRFWMTLGVLGVLCGPVVAQDRVYTNADLGKPIVRTATVTPEQLATLKAREFQAPPAYHGPIVIVVPSSATAGPFGEIAPLSPTAPLSPQAYYDLVPPPMFAWPYGYVSGFPQPHGHAPHVVTPPPAPRPPVVSPSIVLAGASGGARVR
jgi:hypothetical protein